MTKQALKDSYHKLVRRAGRLQISLLSVLALAITVTGYVCLANGPFDGSYFRTRSFQPAEPNPSVASDRPGYHVDQFKPVEKAPRGREGEFARTPFKSRRRLPEVSQSEPEVAHVPLVATEPVALPDAVAVARDLENTESSIASAAGKPPETELSGSDRIGQSAAVPERAEVGAFSGEWFSTEEIVLSTLPPDVEPVRSLPAVDAGTAEADVFSGEWFSTEEIVLPTLPPHVESVRSLPAVDAGTAEADVFSGELFSTGPLTRPTANAGLQANARPEPAASLPPVAVERPVVDAFSGELFSPGLTVLPTETTSPQAVRKANDRIPQPIIKREIPSTTSAEERAFSLVGQAESELPFLTRADATEVPESAPVVAPPLSAAPASIRRRDAMAADVFQQPAQIVSPPVQSEPLIGPEDPATDMLAAGSDDGEVSESPTLRDPPLGLPPVVDRVEQPFAGPFVPPVTPTPIAESSELSPSVPIENPTARQPLGGLDVSPRPSTTAVPAVPAEQVFRAPVPVVDQLPGRLVPRDTRSDVFEPLPVQTATPRPEVPFQSVLGTTPAPEVQQDPVGEVQQDPVGEVQQDPVAEVQRDQLPEIYSGQPEPPVVSTLPLLSVSGSVISQETQLPVTEAPLAVADPLLPTAVEQTSVEAGTGVVESMVQPIEGVGFSCPDTWYLRVEMPHFNREGNKGVSYSTGFRLDDFSFEPGGRLVLGRQRDCLEGWELIFTGMFEWEVEDERDHRAPYNDNNGSPDFYTTLVPIDVDASSFLGAPYQYSRFRSRFDSLELVTKRWGWDVISCTSGLRYFDVTEEFELYSIATDESIGHLRMNTQNKALGYQLGVDVYYPVGRWTMEANLKGSVNANLARGQFRLENGGPWPDFGSLYGNDFSTVSFSGSVELGYHLNYQLSERMKLRAGYEALFLYGMAAAVEQLRDGTLRVNTGTHADTERWIVYHGGTFGLEIAW